MDNIKEKYYDINKQIQLLEEIKIGDKIYYYNNNMYLQSSTILQSIYRTKTVTKYVQDNYTYQIIKQLPVMKQQIITILSILKKTYPENEITLNSLDNFLKSSC